MAIVIHAIIVVGVSVVVHAVIVIMFPRTSTGCRDQRNTSPTISTLIAIHDIVLMRSMLLWRMWRRSISGTVYHSARIGGRISATAMVERRMLLLLGIVG